MELGNLRRYDVQANYAFALALMSIVPAIATLWMAWRRFDPDLGRIIYGSKGKFALAFVGCLALSTAPAALGFIMGWSSAGQRRNDRSRRSWIAFFVGGSVLTLNVVLLIAFLMLRLQPQG